MEFPEVTAEMEGRKSERVEKNHGYCAVREANDEERERERGGRDGNLVDVTRGFVPEGTRSRVVKMKMLSRYQSAGIFQAGEAYIAKER